MKRVLTILPAMFLLIFSTGCGYNSNSSAGEETASHEEGHDEHESEEVELTQAQMDAVGIRLGNMEKRDIADEILATGILEVSARDEAVVTPRLAGLLKRLDVVEGQRVQAGEILGYMESPEILIMHQEYRTTQADMETARTELERQEALASQGAGIKKNLDNARAAFTRAEMQAEQIRGRMKSYGVEKEALSGTTSYPLRAETGGVVTGIDASPGSFVDNQTPVVRIVKTDDVYCMISLQERYANSVAPGAEVEMQLTNSPGATFTGVIADITPMLDPSTRTVPVRVKITDSKDLKLIPGMAVSGRILADGLTTDVLPEEAVVRSGGRYFIFVLEDRHEEDGEMAYHFKKSEVVCGSTSSGYVAVTPMSPIGEDEEIVTAGAFYLNSMSTEHGEHSH